MQISLQEKKSFPKMPVFQKKFIKLYVSSAFFLNASFYNGFAPKSQIIKYNNFFSVLQSMLFKKNCVYWEATSVLSMSNLNSENEFN